MHMLETLIWIIHVLAAATMVGLVLLQHGKGADIGAAFGGGSAGGLFGAGGAANFLSRSTAVLAGVFFVTSLSLTYIGGHASRSSSVVQQIKPVDRKPAVETVQVPAKPVVPGQATSPAAPASSTAPATDSKAKEIPK